jgi:hypothetical protein
MEEKFVQLIEIKMKCHRHVLNLLNAVAKGQTG